MRKPAGLSGVDADAIFAPAWRGARRVELGRGGENTASIAASSRGVSRGFSRKAAAPARKHSASSSGLPKAVMTITGTCAKATTAVPKMVCPPKNGIRRSVMMRSNRSDVLVRCSIASPAQNELVITAPSPLRTFFNARSIAASSSTTRMDFPLMPVINEPPESSPGARIQALEEVTVEQ